MFITTVLLSVLLAVAMLGAGGAKLASVPAMRESAAHLGFTMRAFRGIGALEVAGAVGVLVGLALAPLGVTAAVCLALLLAGAVVTHFRKGDVPALIAPAAVLTLLAVAVAVLRTTTA